MKVTEYNLTGDGDFRSQEVTAIRDQADFIITNPPFSLFREFIDWIWKGPGLNFLVISNINAITYKEIFSKIKDNHMWIGNKFNGKPMMFRVPDDYPLSGTCNNIDDQGNRLVGVGGTCWLTNIQHGRRNQPLYLMDAASNLKHSKHKSIKGKTFEEAYPKYDNYDAIEVSFTDAIPKDYEGVMGVPISFLDKYCPDQFEILGLACGWVNNHNSDSWKTEVGYKSDIVSDQGTRGYGIVNGHQMYHRILIRKKSPENL